MHSSDVRDQKGEGTTATDPPANPVAKPPKRYENIDGLRAIAALAVVLQHYFGDILREASDRTGIAYRVAAAGIDHFDAGRFGVVLFFLISGFVVPFSIRGERPLLRFGVSRFFRLYPAMWLALLCLALLLFVQGPAPGVSTFVANLTMLPQLFGQKWMSGAYWTLTIEIVFYVLSAGLFAAGLLYKPFAIAAFALAMAAATAIPIYLRHIGLSVPIQYISLHVSFLYLGLLLRMALVDRLAGARAGAIAVLVAQAGILLSIGTFSLERNDGFFLVGIGPILAAYVAALLLFLLSVRTGWPTIPLLTWLGALSYSIYLFHGIASLIVFDLFPLTGTWVDGPIMTGCLMLALAMSLFVYECLEKPMIHLGYKLMKRKEISKPQAGVP